jgi:hypothetical protein
VALIIFDVESDIKSSSLCSFIQSPVLPICYIPTFSSAPCPNTPAVNITKTSVVHTREKQMIFNWFMYYIVQVMSIKKQSKICALMGC